MAQMSEHQSYLMILSVGILVSINNGVYLAEYCRGEIFRASCAPDEVVAMQSAVYGRMKLGRCAKINLGYLGCSIDVLKRMDQLCSGKRECSVTPSTDLHIVSPCIEDLAVYLEAAYSCLKIVKGSSVQCQLPGTLHLPPPPGYLANVVAQDTACGDKYHPWIIQVDPTQRINLTLMDFGTYSSGGMGTNIRAVYPCQEYGVVLEQGGDQGYQLCGGIWRIKHAYLSVGNKLHISMTKPTQLAGTHFLIKYEAVGCLQPDYADDMWIKHEHNSVIIGCQQTQQRWLLECRDNVWHGEVGNCTIGMVQASIQGVDTWHLLTSSPDVLNIFMATGLSLILVVLLLTIALCCRCQKVGARRGHYSPKPVPLYDMPPDSTQYGFQGATLAVRAERPDPYNPDHAEPSCAATTEPVINHTAPTISPTAPPPQSQQTLSIPQVTPAPESEEHIYERPIRHKRPINSRDAPFYYELDPDAVATTITEEPKYKSLEKQNINHVADTGGQSSDSDS